MKISVIDLGFNSLKLVSYDVKQDADSSATVYDQKSVPARLGEGLSQTGFLGNEPIRRAIDGLKLFREINELHGIRHCLPVATSAVREAANRDEFLRQVYAETGFRFRVLSGREEALYSYCGAIRALKNSDALFFDVGGGSLEFVCSDGDRIKKILSLPLGGLRLTQLYADKNGSFKSKSYSRMAKRILDLLPSRQELALKESTTFVGVGGSLRALARWDQELRDYPFNKLHNYTLKIGSVEMMTEELSKLSSREIGDIDVMGRDRAESIAAGALVVELAMKKLGFRKVTVSTHGLRDGILASFLDDPVSYHKGKIGKTVRLTLRSRNPERYPVTIRNFVRTLSTFDLIEDRDIQLISYLLKWLAGVAYTLRPEAFFFLMMDDESFLSHRDQLLAALSAAELRRSRSADWLYSRYKSLLKPKSKETIARLAALARFLDIVIRSDSKVRITIVERGSKIRLRIIPGKQQVPESLLRSSIAELGNKLDRFIEYSVKGLPAARELEVRQEIRTRM